jgi:hypothetical protein
MTCDPKFIFVRYCPGSCGNFLISILQQSAKIAHWNPDLDTLRSSDDWKRNYLDWFKSRFQTDLHNHLKSEPHHPYKLDFISAKHPRGDDISTQDFLASLSARNDRHFFDAVQKDKHICLRLHKSMVPVWARNACIINIVVDPDSAKWLHRTRAIKMFGRENDKFISKENHPEFLKHKFPELKFRNPYEFPIHGIRFLRDFVIGEPTLVMFKSAQSITSDPSNKLVTQQIFLDLSDLFDWSRFHRACAAIYDQLDLGQLDFELTRTCWHHYYETHIRRILEKKIPIFGPPKRLET